MRPPFEDGVTPTSRTRTAARWMLGGALVFAGTSHPSFSEDDVALVPGAAEVATAGGRPAGAADRQRRVRSSP